MINTIHDCYVSIHGTPPGLPEMEELVDLLPDSIKLLASEWGWSDTEVRDRTYKWLAERR